MPALPQRPPVQPAARTERVIAVGRAFLAISGFVAIYLDPFEPARLKELTYAVLLGYATYSLVVLAVVRSATRLARTHTLVLHGLDLVWTSTLTLVSEGPVSPFFLFFLFVVLAAAYRWGFRETVATAAVVIVVFLGDTLLATANLGLGSSPGSELNRVILRVAYLMLTGVLLGYLAEQEKESRAEITAMADVTRQPRVDLGLGGSVTAVGRGLLATFGASAADIVVRDLATRRATRWHLTPDSSASRLVRTQRVSLDPEEQAQWLFKAPGRTWHAAAPHEGPPAIARTVQPEAWPLARVPCDLPPVLWRSHSFRTVTSVEMGLAGEWQARVYLFDIVDTGGLERVLHFLEALADHVTPGLTNVFLLRRLRARAGADERARVARELHDGAIQALFGIEMKLEAIRRQAPGVPASLDVDLADVQDLLRREVQALRELMQALRPIEIESDQLPDVIASLVERFRRDTGISARFVAPDQRIDIAPAKAIELVRIVQEALVNVRKHSRAANVLVRLARTDGGCTLVVEDDGCGFAFEGRLSSEDLDARHVGPAIIKERARVAGARLAVDSTPGAGTRIEVALSEVLHA
ncbi:MAG: sensor histidine kinase [Acidobacteriota bacterium]